MDFAHWDKIYTKAASKIQIKTSEDVCMPLALSHSNKGVVLKKVETVAPKTSVYGGMFVKATKEDGPTSCVKEKDLFGECEGSELRIFKQEGKMKRLKEAEEKAGQFDAGKDYFGEAGKEAESTQSKAKSSKRKREDKKEKKHRKHSSSSSDKRKSKRDKKRSKRRKVTEVP
jgi:hypothetical protein